MPRPKKEEQEITATKKSNNNLATFAHGRRKEAKARVRLFKGTGSLLVNDLPIERYFPSEVSKEIYLMPFITTGTMGRFSATVKVEGSGKSGQLGAVVHALANALVGVNAEFKPALRRAGLVTRDPRAKERRKFGLAQKARKRKQSPKR